MTKKRNDYKVYDYRSSAYPELAQWQIRIGESDRLAVVVSTFRDYDKAVETARQLNIDPWFLDRGNTRADRASKIQKCISTTYISLGRNMIRRKKMKISKIPGLGRFGVFVDDLDFDNLSDEEWQQIGQLHLESLVTIIRNVKLSPNEYERRIKQWGTPRKLAILNLLKKYQLTHETNHLIFSNDVVNGVVVTEDDRKYFRNLMNIIAFDISGNKKTNVVKVTGKQA